MVDQKLLDNLNQLGFQLMETRADVDVNETLAEVVKSKDTRLWEGFPVLLANAARDYNFDYNQVQQFLAKKEQQDFRTLLLLSLALFQHYHLSFAWSNQLKKAFSNQDLGRLKKLKKSLTQGNSVSVGNRRFDPSRLKQVFNNYFEQDAEKTRRLKEKHEELSLEYALSQLFSPKQKELFQKKLKGEALNKTEKEYYSRRVKKKVAALANPELHRLAQKLMEY
jgi:Txe/YoeB family toxin of Txe-Axe toxin-antitoxin module